MLQCVVKTCYNKNIKFFFMKKLLIKPMFEE